jgi:hypothetical protein
MVNETKYKNNEELLLFIAPLTKLATQMILSGVLKKNAIRHFTNRGLSFDASENIVNIAIFQASEFQV